jgi:uncharacterized protein
MRRVERTIRPSRPVEVDRVDGLAYSLWMPERAATRGIVILHGAGSCKENHHDYARAAIAAGFAAIAFDQRGHGGSEGVLDGRVLDDTAAIAQRLRARMDNPEAPIALRGSSMGAYLAIVAAAPVNAGAVVAICPASASGLKRAVVDGTLSFPGDADALAQFLSTHDVGTAVESLEAPLLLLHAEGDEVVPVEHSRELAARMANAQSKLIALPGGHHRSIQHDHELQSYTLGWLDRVLA